MSKFDFDKDIPREVLPTLRAALNGLDWMVPLWCQKVYVYWCDDGRDTSMQDNAAIDAFSDYTYRRVTLRFFPCFLSNSISEQREMVIHDVIHSTTGVLYNYAREELKRLLPEDEAAKHRASVLDELNTRHESMTQDLAYMLDTVLLRIKEMEREKQMRKSTAKVFKAVQDRK